MGHPGDQVAMTWSNPWRRPTRLINIGKFMSYQKNRTTNTFQSYSVSLIVTILWILVLFSCKSPARQETTFDARAFAKKDSATHRFHIKDVSNKKDPVCGMPLTAGIGDTLHYKNEVMGFCSEECKNEFLKDPKKYISVADKKMEKVQ
jgi:YHS domain-containing protein